MELFIFINFILFLILLILHFRVYKDGKENHKSAREILKERYARGKISKYEYDVKIRDID